MNDCLTELIEINLLNNIIYHFPELPSQKFWDDFTTQFLAYLFKSSTILIKKQKTLLHKPLTGKTKTPRFKLNFISNIVMVILISKYFFLNKILSHNNNFKSNSYQIS